MRRARRLPVLLVLAVAAGLVVAGTAVPVVGGLGLVTSGAIDSFQELRADLRLPTLPERSRLLDRDGHVIAWFWSQDRQVVPLARVSRRMQQALIAVEDARFYHHGAIDLRGTLRAAFVDLGHGTTAQGASTLTEQYVKNVLELEHPGIAAHRTLTEKLREVRLAVALQHRLTKRQILGRYLNLVYFGQGAYGVEAAAERYFSEPAARLTTVQSALLAGLVQSPTAYDPVLHPAAARARRAEALARMAAAGVISAAQASRLSTRPLGLRVSGAEPGCGASAAPYFCDWVRQRLLADPALGRTVAARARALATGGLTVRTTLDPRVQRAATVAARWVPARNRVAAGIALVRPGSGDLLALAASRGYGSRTSAGETTVNLPAGGATGYQAGSTFKVFTLAAALERGVPLSHTLYAPRQIGFGSFRGCGGRDLGPWRHVHNAVTGEQGTYDLVKATWESVNTYFVQLEHQVGVCDPWRIATAAGIREVATGRPVPQVPAFTLGVADTSPLQVAAAYAMFADHGVYCAPRVVTSVTDAAGHRRDYPPQCRPVVPRHVADVVTSVLRGVIDGPDPARTGAAASIGRPAAGKTGTTDDYSAGWFSGYTPQLAASVWTGDPRGGRAHPLVDVRLRGQVYRRVFGGDIAAHVWRLAMAGALRGTPTQDFAGAGARLARG